MVSIFLFSSDLWSDKTWRWWQDFRQFEVDDAEVTEFVAVGDVARLGVEVANTILALQLGK